MSALVAGGTVVTCDRATSTPHELWRGVAAHRVTQIIIVGDAFAKPMLRALDRTAQYDVSSVGSDRLVGGHVEQGGQAGPACGTCRRSASPNSFGSSEAVGFGLSIMTADGEVETAKFQIGDNVQGVFSAPEGREIVARQRRGRPDRARRPPAGWLLQGPGQDRLDVQDLRRRPLFDPGRLLHGRDRRHDHPDRPRQRLHQHRRRKGLSRGGRGGR